VFDLSSEALAIGTSTDKNDTATKRHKKRKLPLLNLLFMLCFFVATVSAPVSFCTSDRSRVTSTSRLHASDKRIETESFF